MTTTTAARSNAMSVGGLDTPCAIVDLDRVEANLRRAQVYADAHGLALRPHVKTHKLPRFARRQIELGAVGITCQKLGEAESMAEAGLDDILIPYNILGTAKLRRLRRLHDRLALTACADNATAIDGYGAACDDPAHPLPVMLECDTGAGRCGVQSAAEARDLAERVRAAPGLTFAGLLTYPPKGDPAAVDRWLAGAVRHLAEAGIETPCVSNGGSPDFYASGDLATVTEHRPGTYIYSDRMQVSRGLGTLEDCALTVLATVVSRPTADRAILDAGSKALAADTCAAPGHGHVWEYPEALISGLSEEHGIVDVSACPRTPDIGEVVRVIPNHACVVTNLFDSIVLAQEGGVVEETPIPARGCVR